MKKELKFKNARGELTPYALMCGYVQQVEKDGIQTTLWGDSNGYNVRQHNFNEGKRIFWEDFTKLSDARKRYKQAITLLTIWKKLNAHGAKAKVITGIK